MLEFILIHGGYIYFVHEIKLLINNLCHVRFGPCYKF
jgi:hypothetical protein